MCTEGQLFAQLFDQMVRFAHSYYGNVISLCGLALHAWAGVWFTWRLTDLALARGIDPKEVTEQILIFIAVDSLYFLPDLAWNLVDLIMSFGIFAAGQTNPNNGPTVSGFGGIVCYALGGIDDSLGSTVRFLIQNLSINALASGLWIVLLWLVTSFLMVKIIKAMVSPLTHFFSVMVLLPVILLLFTMPPLRLAAANAIKLLIASAQQLIVISAMVALLMQMLLHTAGLLPVTGSVVTGQVGTWLASPSYFLILFALGLLCFAFDTVLQVPATLLGISVPRSKP